MLLSGDEDTTTAAPAPKETNPSALRMCRIRKWESPPLRSLYIYVRSTRMRCSLRPPRQSVARKVSGIAMRMRRCADGRDSRPEGIARQGLLIESSRIESGRRWLARLKMKRLSQVQRIAEGSREKMTGREGVVDVAVRWGPERAAARANEVVGRTVVFKSLLVMR